MPEDNNPSIAELNNTLNNLTERRLETAHRTAQVAHAESPTPGTFADILAAQRALDTFWEASVAEQQQATTEAQNLPGLPDNTESWFQKTEAADERRRIADLYEDDPEYQALGSAVEERETAIAEAAGVLRTPNQVPYWDVTLEERAFEAQLSENNEVDGLYSPGWQRQADINDGLQSAAEYRPQAHRGPASFADEVDAWYAAVQPTGEIRRVQDADLFDPDGYSQQPDAVATAAPPVSDEFAAAFQPGNEWWNRPENKALPDGPAARWDTRLQQNPSLASAVTRHPSAGQGPPMPKPGLSPKV